MIDRVGKFNSKYQTYWMSWFKIDYDGWRDWKKKSYS